MLAKNACYALRDSTQFWPIALAYHLDVQANRAVFDKTLPEVTINPKYHSGKKIAAKLKQLESDERIVFTCLQSLDQATPALQTKLLNWLSERIQ